MCKPDVIHRADGYTIKASMLEPGETCICPDKNTTVQRIDGKYKLTTLKGKIVPSPKIKHM